MAAVLLAFIWTAPAPAQETGQIRVQDRPQAGEAPPTPGLGPVVRDYAEDMRRFIQSIGRFARHHKRDFVVIVQNGLELLSKAEGGDVLKQVAARTYMRSVEGVLVEGMHFGRKKFGVPTPPEQRARMMAQLNFAKQARHKILAVDYTDTRAEIDKAYAFAREKGFIPFVAHAKGPDLNTIPPYPTIPFGENPKSLLSMSQVKNFAWIQDSSAYGQEAEYALTMHRNNFDLLITDAFHGLEPLGRKAVDTLKFKQIGSRRLVLAHINIGTAASYQYYWKPHWRKGSPIWIKAPVAGNPDQYYVEYWRPEWQQIVSGDTNSFIYGLVRQGYDGVILDGVEAYRFFDGTLREGNDDQFLTQ